MPLKPNHLKKFLEDTSNERFHSELLNLLIKRVQKLCFEECEKDRIQCTLSPLCRHRYLLNLRIKNGLKFEAIPKFCYSVQKDIILRDFWNKTIIYKPFDTYIYMVDFLDIFFHGDYRKLNKFISFEQWEKSLAIFDDRRLNRNEDFTYHLTENYMIFMYRNRLHIIFLNDKIVLCSAFRETFGTLELLNGVIELYKKTNFPDIKVRLIKEKHIKIQLRLPHDIFADISEGLNEEDQVASKLDDYFWNTLPKDFEALMDVCQEIHIKTDRHKNIIIKLCVGLISNNHDEKNELKALQFKDMRLILNFIQFIYNNFYIIWV